MLIVTEVLLGSGLAVTTSTMSIINPSTCIVLISSTTLLSSIAILITNEYISKLKTRYTKFRNWLLVISFLYEKALKQSMIDKKVDENEALEFKKIYIHYLDERKESMTSSQFRVEDVFGHVRSEDSI